MNTTELLEQVYAASFVDDAHPVYTPARIMLELTNAQNKIFSPILVKARQGYGLRWITTTLASGDMFVRIPQRSIVNSLERVDLSTDGTNFYKLLEATPREWPRIEALSGTPSRYMKRGDKLFLGPVANATYYVRLWYYLRPSQLQTAQTAGNIDSGIGIGSTTPYVWVSSKPVRYTSVGGSTTPLVVGDRIDIVTSDGLYDVIIADGVITSIGGGPPYQIRFTIADADDSFQLLSGAGQYVRAAQQTDWPALPVDFHSTLADAAAVTVLMGLGKRDKAGALQEKLNGDLARFQDLINPRVKEDPYVARPTLGILHGGSRRYMGGLP